MMKHTPVTVFLAYAHEDEPLRKELEKHLSLLQRQGLVSTWQDRHIMAGTDWAREIDEHLKSASIILLLISADFLASDYCYGVEMQRALDRDKASQARVIPIIVRPVNWKGAPFAHLQVLPTDARAITAWNNRDEAWTDVANGIRKVLEGLLNDEGEQETPSSKEQPSVQGQKQSAHLDLFPAMWNVPYRYAFFFTGRDRLIEQLLTNFVSPYDAGTI